MIRLVLAVAAASAVACGGPKPGDQCNQVTCGDNHTMLRCDTGVYQALHCPGPQGCFEQNTGDTYYVICDLTGTVAGDGCTTGMSGFVYCLSATTALICNSVDFVQSTCTQSCVDSAGDGTGGICQ